MTITSTPQISSINKVTITNMLHKVGTLTMTNARALNLWIDLISGEVTRLPMDRPIPAPNTPRNTVPGVLCDLLEYTFVGEDISGYNGGWAGHPSCVNSVLHRT